MHGSFRLKQHPAHTQGPPPPLLGVGVGISACTGPASAANCRAMGTLAARTALLESTLKEASIESRCSVFAQDYLIAGWASEKQAKRWI